MVAKRVTGELHSDLRLIDNMGKALPVDVLQAFVNSMLDLMLWGGPQTAIVLAEEFFPELPGKTQTGEHNPFWPYYYHRFNERKSLNYVFISALCRGVVKFYGPQGGARLLLRTGSIWWAGPRPEFCVPRSMAEMVKEQRSDHRQTDSLRKFLAPDILAALRQYFPSATEGALDELPGFKYTVAFEALGRVLTDKTGVVCRVGHAENGFVFEFPACPFCLNEMDECRVWEGMLQSFYEWLFGKPVTLSAGGTEQHRIVIPVGAG